MDQWALRKKMSLADEFPLKRRLLFRVKVLIYWRLCIISMISSKSINLYLWKKKTKNIFYALKYVKIMGHFQIHWDTFFGATGHLEHLGTHLLSLRGVVAVSQGQPRCTLFIGGGPSYAGIEQNSNHHQLSLKNSGDIMIYLSYQKKNNVSLEARTTEHFSKPGHHLAAYVIVVSPKICAQIRLRSHGPIEREVDLPTKNGDVP